MSNEIIETGTGRTDFLTSEGEEMPFQILIGWGQRRKALKNDYESKIAPQAKIF